jgi:hypothetical protein
MNRFVLEYPMRRAALIAVAVMLGCSGKTAPLSSEGQAMLKKFETHLPRHKVEAFESMCKDVEKLHDSKKITPEEYEALHKVCGPASTGQWDRAQVAFDALTKAQQAEKK